MEGTVEGNHLRATGVLFGDLERTFVGLGASHREVHRLQTCRKLRAEQLRIFHLRALDKLAVHHNMKVPVCLRLDGFYDPGVSVPDV